MDTTATRLTGARPRGQPQPRQDSTPLKPKRQYQARSKALRDVCSARAPGVPRARLRGEPQGPGLGPALVTQGPMGWAGGRGWGVKHGVWRQRGCSALGTRRGARVVCWELWGGQTLAQTPALSRARRPQASHCPAAVSCPSEGAVFPTFYSTFRFPL